VRVVLDTNVLLSSLLNSAGVPGALVDAWREGRYVSLSYELQFGELRSVTRRDYLRSRIRPAQAGKLVNQIRA
jgi:predicted nucleic acid-binding protein